MSRFGLIADSIGIDILMQPAIEGFFHVCRREIRADTVTPYHFQILCNTAARHHIRQSGGNRRIGGRGRISIDFRLMHRLRPHKHAVSRIFIVHQRQKTEVTELFFPLIGEIDLCGQS